MSVYTWAMRMLYEIRRHATEENCDRCKQMIDDMANEAKAKQKRVEARKQ